MYNGSKQFKPMLFKGQLQIQNSEAVKSNIKVLADSLPSKGSLLASKCPHFHAL